MELGILRVLLVRHGLSDDNQNAIRSGHRDPPLTEIGAQQAKALGAALANYSFHAIYTSDLKRASRTAEEILAANQSIPPPPLVQTQSLREQNYGQAAGRSLNDPEFALPDDAGRTFRFADGETLDDVNARMGVSLRRYVLPRLEALRSMHGRSEPQIIIVTHEIAIAEILRVLINMHDAGGNALWPPPQETYRRVRMDFTGWTLVELAVPLAEGGSPVGSGRKPIYVRIVKQNITNHLHGIGAGKEYEGVHGAGEITIGGSSGSSTTTSGGARFSPTASLSKLNLRTVNTYDSRYLRRELERASTLPGTATADPTVSSGSGAAGSTSLSNIALANPSANSSSATWSDAWQAVCVQILPLFSSNEEQRTSIEEINDQVSEHIRRCLERSPARALDTLSRDLYAICTAGMYALNAKLSQIDLDVRLLQCLVEMWKRFHWHTLPWLEMCFMPLQTDATLVSLTTMRDNQDNPTSMLRNEPIDVSRVALTVFRDQLILPRFDRLFALFLRIDEAERQHLRLLADGATMTRSSDDLDDTGDIDNGYSTVEREESRQIYPRLLQMCCLLHSAQTNDDDNQTAMNGLVHALRTGHDSKRHLESGGGGGGGGGGTLADFSFMSTPSRDAKRAQARQGWLPQSASKHGVSVVAATGKRAGEEREFLSSLRSPSIAQEEAVSATTGAGDDLSDSIDNGDVDTSGEVSILPTAPRRPHSAGGSSADSSSIDVSRGNFLVSQQNVVGLGLE